jgi:hypothetical protein
MDDMKAKDLRNKVIVLLLVIGAIAFLPGVSQAKGGDDQNQVILLNDSAAALEDSNPGLSKRLAQFADEKEKEWEFKNANKDAPPIPVSDKDLPQLQYRIKLLKEAALDIKPTYPLIAQSLLKMARDINRTIEIEK